MWKIRKSKPLTYQTSPIFTVYSIELSTMVSEVLVFLFCRKVIGTVLVPQKRGKNPNYEVRGGFETASLNWVICFTIFQCRRVHSLKCFTNQMLSKPASYLLTNIPQGKQNWPIAGILNVPLTSHCNSVPWMTTNFSSWNISPSLHLYSSNAFPSPNIMLCAILLLDSLSPSFVSRFVHALYLFSKYTSGRLSIPYFTSWRNGRASIVSSTKKVFKQYLLKKKSVICLN